MFHGVLCLGIRNFTTSIIREIARQADKFIIWVPILQGMGIILYFSLDKEPSDISVVIIAALGILALCVVLYNKRFLFLIVLIPISVGFAGSYVRTKALYPNYYPIKHRIYVKNVVSTLREVEYKVHHVQLLVCDVKWVQRHFGGCVRVAVRTKMDSAIKIGDEITFSGILYPPAAATSYNGYDYARAMYFEQIGALGFTTSEVKLHRPGEKVGLRDRIGRLRLNLYKRIAQGLDRDTAEVISTLLIGKRGGIRPEVWDNIRKSGLAHIFAISGLHLSFVAGLCFVLFRYAAACSETLTLRWNTKKLCAFMAIIVSFCYLLLSGSSVSASRAFIMVFLTFLGILIGRRHNSLYSLSVAAFVILLVMPESILGASFQMSFAAVVSLIILGNLTYAMLSSHSICKYVTAVAKSSIIASIATAPYVVYHFHQLSVVGVIANVIAVPLTTFVILPLGMLYLGVCNMPFLMTPVSYLLQSSVHVVLGLAAQMAKIKWLILDYGCIPSISIVSITMGALIAFLWQGKRGKVLCGGLFLLFGIAMAITHRIPDILCNHNSVVIKDGDGKLYFALRRGRLQGLTYKAWARTNKQDQILSRAVGDGSDTRLFCEAGGCIYGGRVLITYNNAFAVKHCKSADFVINYAEEPYPSECYGIEHIGLSEIDNYGVHYLWVQQGKTLRVEKSITQRIWHRNAAGWLRSSSARRHNKPWILPSKTFPNKHFP